MRRGEVVALGRILGHVVQLPLVLARRGRRGSRRPRCSAPMPIGSERHGLPSLVVEGAARETARSTAWCGARARCRSAERRVEADARERLLLDAVQHRAAALHRRRRGSFAATSTACTYWCRTLAVSFRRPTRATALRHRGRATINGSPIPPSCPSRASNASERRVARIRPTPWVVAVAVGTTELVEQPHRGGEIVRHAVEDEVSR